MHTLSRNPEKPDGHGARVAPPPATLDTARTRRTVTAFLDALERGDSDGLRATLTHGRFDFVGALDRFDDVDAFVADIEHFSLILTGVERRRLLVDGNEACVVLTYLTCLDNLARTRAAAWLTADATGLICRVESFLDPRAYAGMFEDDGRRR